MQKKILFLNRSAPHGTAHAQDALDILLMASSFDQAVSVAFMDDGVFQLMLEQNTSVIETKNFCAAFKALPLYDIDKVYVEQESLHARGLDAKDLMVPVELVSSAQLAELMNHQDVVFNV